MAYTPELEYEYSCILRRIAWGHDQPMTKAIETVFDVAIKQMDKKTICKKCKDKSRCSYCVFDSKT